MAVRRKGTYCVTQKRQVDDFSDLTGDSFYVKHFKAKGTSVDELSYEG